MEALVPLVVEVKLRYTNGVPIDSTIWNSINHHIFCYIAAMSWLASCIVVEETREAFEKLISNPKSLGTFSHAPARICWFWNSNVLQGVGVDN